MTKRKDLHRQSVISIRITNDIDDGFLKWMNELHSKGSLQRMAIEGLYMMYSKELQIPGRWIHVPMESKGVISRDVLTQLRPIIDETNEPLVQSGTSRTTDVVSKSVESPQVNIDPDKDGQPGDDSNNDNPEMSEVLKNALKFMEDY